MTPDDSPLQSPPSGAPPDGGPAADASLAQDPELVADFVLESREHLAAAETRLLELEHNPVNADALNAVFRSFHTIKGIAGFLALGEIQSVAHETESVLALAREGQMPVSPALIDTTLAAGDYLGRAIGEVEDATRGGRSPVFPDPAPLLARVGALAAGGAASEALSPAPAPQAESGDGKPGKRAASAAVKVDTAKLDYLVDMVGEMVIAESMLRHHPELRRTGGSTTLQRHLLQLSRITGEVQKTTMSMRMIPIGQLFGRMARVVRDLSRKSGKPLELETSGEETEVDRNIVEALSDPLLHMIRNSVDHGIEPPAERLQRHKCETGRVTLRARHDSGYIVIEVADDGRGLDAAKILAKARALGLVAADAQPPDAEIFNLIFEPGFSTAEKVTNLSGRGVGMDVVRKQVQGLRGRIEVRTTLGQGTRFLLRLPLTLAIIDGVVVAVGAERYIVPLFAIKEMLRPRPGMITTVEGRSEVALIRGRLFPVVRLYQRFGVAPTSEVPEECLLILTESGGRDFCLMVDHCLGKQEVVIKSLGEALTGIPGVTGGAILGDGRVGLILDMENLFGRAAA